MRDLKITCDNCGGDLTYTGYAREYRICLKSEQMSCKSIAVYGMMFDPQFENDLHFCGKGCLMSYLKKDHQ